MRHKAVFLDRDGTIIKDTNHIISPGEVALLPKAAEGIKRFKAAGYKIIVVSNQSAVARGYITMRELSAIDKRFRKLLLAKSAKIDAVYYCPHFKDGIVKRYSVDCGCRKPKTGMLVKAIKAHKVDLSKSVMIGDSIRDILAGKAICVKTILIKSRNTDKELLRKADLVATNLVEASKKFTKILT